jgi:hypothetical protein
MQVTLKKPAHWRLIKWSVLGIAVLAIGISIASWITNTYQFWDSAPDRGAIPMSKPDKFGEHFDQVVYLKEQGWEAKDSLWYYNVSQGSNLMPYDFFLVLEQKDKEVAFRDDANINDYHYLPQKSTFSNPDGLPVGFVADTYRDVKYFGLSCAACHTGQVNYQGTAIRIDGGPSGADMETFIADLGQALSATAQNPAKLKRFTDAVLKLGTYKTADKVAEDLATYAQRINLYVAINDPIRQSDKGSSSHYHYGRLDAFGRIYNRVLEHVISLEQLMEILLKTFTSEELAEIMQGVEWVLSQQDRDHVVARIQSCKKANGSPCVSDVDQLKLLDKIFIKADAPVSYPFLWDIPQHDYVQWNGIGANGGVGPLGRNAGEVMGVFGTLDWQKKPGWTLSSALGGQGWFTSSYVDYQSSVNVSNLRQIEHQLVSLKSPLWPEAILGKLDQTRLERGAMLFDDHCQSCHQEINRESSERRVVASMIKLDEIKTDSKMSDNSINYTGYSGILRNLYVATGVGDILIQAKSPVAALLTKADQNVLVTPDPDKWKIRSFFERIYDFVVALRDNEIHPSIKQGDYSPDTTVRPFSSLQAYKGRSLNGIWATAPYLHNGSVPSLYELLLPKKGDCVVEDGEYRPETFKVGSREYVPMKGGFRSDVGELFDTTQTGNGNGGHNYGGCDQLNPDKSIKRKALTREERLDLLEYLKSL